LSEPPIFVLGVSRSGTTLLRRMLDRHSQLAIPDESFFIPQLADRHRGNLDPDTFADDLRRLPTLREWGVPVEQMRARLRPGMSLGEAVGSVYETYAAMHGKPRWGDKTPMYMQHLGLLEGLCPTALYVHLIRDGRDAAVSFLAMPKGVAARSWALPYSAVDFACLWRRDVRAARDLGRRVGAPRYLEVCYETLVAEPERELRRIGSFGGLGFEQAMLDPAREIDLEAKPHQQSLRRPVRPGLRDWRRELSPEQERAFEGVAGDLLRELGYEADGGPTVAGRLRRVTYSARVVSWRAASYGLRRSPLWRRRHPPLS
jgi:hypothetical protein